MRFWLLFAGLIFLGACVSNKKVTLLQKHDVNVKELPKNEVVRSYPLDTFDYQVQPHDILSIQFTSLTEKNFDFFSPGNQQANSTNLTSSNAALLGEIVDEEGNIPFPVVGKVKVAGLNIFEIQLKLQDVADDYLEAPLVKVRLLNFRITILGEVNREGQVLLSNNKVTMMEALGSAGGMNDLADRSNVKLIRYNKGNSEVIYLNMLDENFMTSQYYYVHQNDVIIVPALRQRPFRRYFAQNVGVVVSTLSLLLLVFNLTK